ncbi:MAG: MFS transporter [Planctomycetes bacterium]|nr:MFS transporter [Planctomycetota bacterium]
MLPDPSQRARLFLASCIALIATAMSFAVRGDIMGALGTDFRLDKEQLGWIGGTAFWGFTVSIVVGGPLCDWLGMRLLLRLAFVGHLAGTLITIFAGGFWALFGGTLAIGLANGLVEAACNPLIATVYPDQKTQKLNHFHVWFPGGIVIGGVLAYLITKAMGLDAAVVEPGTLSLGWQIKMALLLVPTIAYGVLFTGVTFPPTERVASGIGAGSMFKECARPLFLLMLVCMLMTASTELGPNQWIPNILTQTAGVAGILVLVWINGLMAVGRQFAGPVVHSLSPTGMLLGSAVVGGIGLYLLSIADSGAAAFGAATVFALGICYFWPTMLGFVSERLPRTGALGLALMGGAGMLSVSFVLPLMGARFDTETERAIPTDIGYPTLAALREAAGSSEVAAGHLREAEAAGGAAALQYVLVLPLVLAVVFGLLFLRDRARGGYRAERLGAAE